MFVVYFQKVFKSRYRSRWALLATPISGIPTCDTFFKPPMGTLPSGMVDGLMLSFVAEIGHFRRISFFFALNLWHPFSPFFTKGWNYWSTPGMLQIKLSITEFLKFLKNLQKWRRQSQKRDFHIFSHNFFVPTDLVGFDPSKFASWPGASFEGLSSLVIQKMAALLTLLRVKNRKKWLCQNALWRPILWNKTFSVRLRDMIGPIKGNFPPSQSILEKFYRPRIR